MKYQNKNLYPKWFMSLSSSAQRCDGNGSVVKRDFKHKIILFVTIRGNSFTLSSPYLFFSPFIAGLDWPCKFGRKDCLGFSLSV